MKRILELSALPLVLFLSLCGVVAAPALAVQSQDGLPSTALAEASEPDTGALRMALEPVLTTQAGRVEAPRAVSTSSEAGQGVPELSIEEVGRLIIQAISGKSWSLLASLLLVGVVLVLRKVGGKALPWLDSPKGAVFLSAVGGTGTLLAIALGGGQPFSLGLLVSCFISAAGAAGLWSWGQTVRSGTAKASAAAECTPREVANGTCRPS